MTCHFLSSPKMTTVEGWFVKMYELIDNHFMWFLFYFRVKLKQFEKFQDTTEALAGLNISYSLFSCPCFALGATNFQYYSDFSIFIVYLKGYLFELCLKLSMMMQ